jgi:hypothetical protein
MKKEIAVFTIWKDEAFFAPMWINHYKNSGFAPEDIYILDHESTDCCAQGWGVNTQLVHCEHAFDHAWLTQTVKDFQKLLLEKYERVIFAEADELIVCSENKNLVEYLKTQPWDVIKLNGWEVWGGSKWYKNARYDKPNIAKVEVNWEYGYHGCTNQGIHYDPSIFMVHLHKLSYVEAWKKKKHMGTFKWDPQAISGQLSFQNQIKDRLAFTRFYNETGGSTLEDIPDWLIERDLW